MEVAGGQVWEERGELRFGHMDSKMSAQWLYLCPRTGVSCGDGISWGWWGECPGKSVAAVGGDNRDHGLIGQHMEGMWPCAGGSGREETPRGQPAEASAVNRKKEGTGTWCGGSTGWFLVLCFKETQWHEWMS